jgi:GNAT superfamily N-acetyltransferase
MEAVRRAGPEDLAACRSLLAQAVGGEADLLEHLVATRLQGGDDQGVVLVGTYQQAAVGLLLARVVDEDGHPLGLLELCYVEPAAREVGVGAALLAAAEDWAREAGAADLQAVARPGDRSTKRLFESAGFKTRWLVLRRPVSDASRPPAR